MLLVFQFKHIVALSSAYAMLFLMLLLSLQLINNKNDINLKLISRINTDNKRGNEREGKEKQPEEIHFTHFTVSENAF